MHDGIVEPFEGGYAAYVLQRVERDRLTPRPKPSGRTCCRHHNMGSARRNVEPFEGGYAAYVLQRVERDRLTAAAEAKRQNLLHPEIDVVDAYEIQLINIRQRVAEGARVVGHKVGLSSPIMQQMMGLDTPTSSTAVTGPPNRIGAT